MNETITIIPSIIYFIIGVISMIMAVKSLSSRQFLPFHQKAYGKKWEDVDRNLQHVILALLKISGLGFLVVSILLLSYPIVCYLTPDPYIKYMIPATALIFCTGLFLINFDLYKKTEAETPWKNSLFVMIVMIISMLISSILSYI
jgi:hypothetical protein